MANTRKGKRDETEGQGLSQISEFIKDKGFRRQVNQLNNLLGEANMTMYGTDRQSDTDSLDKKFNEILRNEMSSLTNSDKDDFSSLLYKINEDDRSKDISDNLLSANFENINGDDFGGMKTFIEDAYRNRLLKQNDLHEVASSLIELKEAITITRNAIITSDVVEGKISRSIKLPNIDDDDAENARSIIEAVEKKFDLHNKIKNFILRNTLEYGEYYAYVVPYSKIFNDFVKERNKNRNYHPYRESTLYESVTEEYSHTKPTVIKGTQIKHEKSFAEEIYLEYELPNAKEREKSNPTETEAEFKKAYMEDVDNILGNISICNDEVPIPVLEEGIDSLSNFNEFYMRESGCKVKDNIDSVFTESERAERSRFFDGISKEEQKSASEGVSFINDTKGKKNNKKENFDDINDCYIKLIEPTKMIPIKIMNKVIGYYYVLCDDITPLGGMLSGSLYYNKFDPNRKEQSIIDKIAEKVVMAFDKPFLKNNASFKEHIVECINYYNLNEKKIRFQFIPAEYVQEFKINVDEKGNGTSMIADSLFYAKLYLMLLLFKIMSIILYSNDTKVNYIRTSGIDKNVIGQVQEIARAKQNRQINMYDLFNYSGIINKVGNGTEMYVPVGRSGTRPVETEILSGQEVQLNTELLEMLKNAYIISTHVPQAILNFLSEAEFAKETEQRHSSFIAAIVDYQIDFNNSITGLYRRILKYSTTLPAHVIENMEFTFQPPKSQATSTKSEVITNFNALCEFVVGLYYGQNEDQDPKVAAQIKRFRINFAKEQLPMLNFEKIEEIVNQSNIDAIEETIKPNPSNGDNGDDMGLEEDMANIDIGDTE